MHAQNSEHSSNKTKEYISRINEQCLWIMNLLTYFIFSSLQSPSNGWTLCSFVTVSLPATTLISSHSSILFLTFVLVLGQEMNYKKENRKLKVTTKSTQIVLKLVKLDEFREFFPSPRQYNQQGIVFPWHMFLCLLFCLLYTVCLKKTGPLRLIWHNFTSSQHFVSWF